MNIFDAARNLEERLNREQVCEITTGHRWVCSYCGKVLYPPSETGTTETFGSIDTEPFRREE